MQELDPSTVVVAGPDNLSTEVEDETVLLQMDAGKYYGMNETAAFVWERITEPTTVESICEDLMEEYGITHEQARADINHLLEDLMQAGLVEVADTQ